MDSLPDERAIRAIAEAGISSPGSALPHQPDLQPLFGRHRLANLRVHSDAQAVAAADRLGAQAYTYKGQIVLRPGASLHETAHESAHALLEQQGFAAQTAIGRPQDPPERLAESVARGATTRQLVAPLLDAAITAGSLPRANPAGTVQRIIKYNFNDQGKEPKSIEQVESILEKKLSPTAYNNWKTKYRDTVINMLASPLLFTSLDEADFIFNMSDDLYFKEQIFERSPAPEEKAAPLSTNPYRKLLQKAVAPVVKTEFPAVNFDQILQGLPAVQWKADEHRGADNKFQFNSLQQSINCYEFAFLLAHQCGYISEEDILWLNIDHKSDKSAISQMISIVKQEAIPLPTGAYGTCQVGDIIFLNAPEVHTAISVGGNNILELGSNTNGIRQTTIEQMRKGYLFCSSLSSITHDSVLNCALSVGADTDLDTAEMYHYLFGNGELPSHQFAWEHWSDFKKEIDDFISLRSKHDVSHLELIKHINSYSTTTSEHEQKQKQANNTPSSSDNIVKARLMSKPLKTALLTLADVKVCRAPRERWVGRMKAIVAEEKRKASQRPSGCWL